MGRNFIIAQETMVNADGEELGLSYGPIRIIPSFKHQDLKADDFGPDVPPNVLWMLGTCTISMTLIHFDEQVLDDVINKSMGGSEDGVLAAAGTPMNDNYVSLNIQPSGIALPWSFPSAYLADSPFEYPLGSQVSAVVLRWRAIPFTSAVNPSSQGAALWSR